MAGPVLRPVLRPVQRRWRCYVILAQAGIQCSGDGAVRLERRHKMETYDPLVPRDLPKGRCGKVARRSVDQNSRARECRARGNRKRRQREAILWQPSAKVDILNLAPPVRRPHKSRRALRWRLVMSAKIKCSECGAEITNLKFSPGRWQVRRRGVEPIEYRDGRRPKGTFQDRGVFGAR